MNYVVAYIIACLIIFTAITLIGIGFGALMLWMDERIQGDMDE